MKSPHDVSAAEDFERWGGAAAWSSSAELTPMQTLLWRAERCLLYTSDAADE